MEFIFTVYVLYRPIIYKEVAGKIKRSYKKIRQLLISTVIILYKCSLHILCDDPAQEAKTH